MYLPPDTWAEHRVHWLIPTAQQMEAMMAKADLKISSVSLDGSNGRILCIQK